KIDGDDGPEAVRRLDHEAVTVPGQPRQHGRHFRNPPLHDAFSLARTDRQAGRLSGHRIAGDDPATHAVTGAERSPFDHGSPPPASYKWQQARDARRIAADDDDSAAATAAGANRRAHADAAS